MLQSNLSKLSFVQPLSWSTIVLGRLPSIVCPTLIIQHDFTHGRSDTARDRLACKSIINVRLYNTFARTRRCRWPFPNVA